MLVGGVLLPLVGVAGSPGAFPYMVTSRVLDNGLTVHVVPMKSNGVVAYGTWMAVGSRDEVDEGRTGFAHFFEHLMFLGTPTVPAEAREDALLRMAADDNAWTWLDETVYHTVLPASGLPRLVALEADRFMHLTLTEDDVRREAGAVYGEFRKGKVRPGWQLSEALFAEAFREHTYGHSTIGHEADIADMPTAHGYAETFFQRHYRPERATVLVVGDVDAEAVLDLVEGAYGPWAPPDVAGAQDVPPIADEPPQEATRRVHVPWPSPTAPRLAMGWRVPGASPDDPEVAALELAGELLLSEVGPLHRRLVLEDGVAFTVRGGRGDFVDPCLFEVEVLARPDAELSRVEAMVLEEVAKLAAGVDPEALALARTRHRQAFLSSLDEPEQVLLALGWALRRGGRPDAIDRWYATLDAVTPEDLQAAVTRYLQPGGLTVATLAHDDADSEEVP